MNKNSNTVVSKCGTSTLARPKFSAGMLLQHDDLDQLSIYTRDLSRLLFRSLFGCGVVCGLKVRPTHECGKVCIEVTAGVALNCAGDPIHVPDKVSLVLDEHCNQGLSASTLWVVLCATTKCCAPRASTCASDDDEAQAICTREREGFEINVVKGKPACACMCDVEENEEYKTPSENKCRCIEPPGPGKCYEKHYAGECGCPCGDCSSGCNDNCVVLARLTRRGEGENVKWTSDHRVRRFIRPLLMVDPKPENDRQEMENQKKKETSDETPAEAFATATVRQQLDQLQPRTISMARRPTPPATMKKPSKPGPKR